jgi:hypothetical protein
MKEPKIGVTSYPRPFGIGYLNPRLNKQHFELTEEQADDFAVHIGSLMESPDPDEEMWGTWHIEKRNAPVGFIHFASPSGKPSQAKN